MANNGKISDEGPGVRFGENLLSPSLVRLFGREFEGLLLNEANNAAVLDQISHPRNQLAENLTADEREQYRPRLANIYGFSYEGNYYKMSAPAIFLVHGPGHPVMPGQDPINLSTLGVEFKDQVFASGVLMWGYDKLDQMLRIDITSGWVEDVLLDAELGAMNVTGDEGGSDLVGRSAMVGRSALVGRSAMTGRNRRK